MLAREDITAALRERLEPLAYVHAFWLEGADAGGMTDEYSDLDYWLDVDDDAVDSAIQAVEAALASLGELDFHYLMPHGHPKIRQRIYHIAGSNPYLMIDFCWQLHSRAREEFVYTQGDTIEAVKLVFDKNEVIRYKPYNAAEYEEENRRRLAAACYRRSQTLRAEKYVRRGQYLEAYAYYNRYALEPLIDLLRIRYTPAHSDYYLVHISQHIPQAARERLEYFAQIASLADIRRKLPEAGAWFDQLLAGMERG